MELSHRVKGLSSSVTLLINSKANELKKQGIDVVSFGAGEPDFPTPDFVKEAAYEAIKNNFTHYTPASGIPELKEAITNRVKTDFNLDYSIKEVVVSAGAKQSLFNALYVLCNNGDEVIVITPVWVSYVEQIKLSGGVPVVVETKMENGFLPSIEDIERKITNRTKVIMINSPNNPTGAVYPESLLREIGELSIKKNIFVISDEIYAPFIYSGKPHVGIVNAYPDTRGNTIIINGVSKAYSMTGWRIGYALGPQEVISAMSKVQSHTTSCPSSVSQKAALAALTGPQQFIQNMKDAFKERRDYLFKELSSIEGVEAKLPEGAFYLFPKIEGIFKNCEEFANRLLEEKSVAVVPGSAFLANGYIRLSYATSMEDIKEGAKRIKEFSSTLRSL